MRGRLKANIRFKRPVKGSRMPLQGHVWAFEGIVKGFWLPRLPFLASLTYCFLLWLPGCLGLPCCLGWSALWLVGCWAWGPHPGTATHWIPCGRLRPFGRPKASECDYSVNFLLFGMDGWGTLLASPILPSLGMKGELAPSERRQSCVFVFIRANGVKELGLAPGLGSGPGPSGPLGQHVFLWFRFCY